MCPICRDEGRTPIIRRPDDLKGGIEWVPCPARCPASKPDATVLLGPQRARVRFSGNPKIDAHLGHCNQGENIGHCKYGSMFEPEPDTLAFYERWAGHPLPQITDPDIVGDDDESNWKCPALDLAPPISGVELITRLIAEGLQQQDSLDTIAKRILDRQHIGDVWYEPYLPDEYYARLREEE